MVSSTVCLSFLLLRDMETFPCFDYCEECSCEERRVNVFEYQFPVCVDDRS